MSTTQSLLCGLMIGGCVYWVGLCAYLTVCT